jgi:hypothetical protein
LFLSGVQFSEVVVALCQVELERSDTEITITEFLLDVACLCCIFEATANHAHATRYVKPCLQVSPWLRDEFAPDG